MIPSTIYIMHTSIYADNNDNDNDNDDRDIDRDRRCIRGTRGSSTRSWCICYP